MPTDSVLESPSAWRFAEESTTAAGGLEGGERLATMAGGSTETPGATVSGTESSKAKAGAADVMPESGAQRPAASEEKAAHPKMP